MPSKGISGGNYELFVMLKTPPVRRNLFTEFLSCESIDRKDSDMDVTLPNQTRRARLRSYR